MEKTIKTDYLLLDRKQLKQTVRDTVACLRGVSFDAIAYTGQSGALIAPTVALRLNKHLILVRKKDDKSTHSPHRVEGYTEAKRVVILDDFMASGMTHARVHRALQQFVPQAEILGMFEYKNADPEYFTQTGHRLEQPKNWTLERADKEVTEEK